MSRIRKALIDAGVKHLIEFGYPSCNHGNVTTDVIYKAFFKKMVEGTMEDKLATPEVKDECKKLIEEMS